MRPLFPEMPYLCPHVLCHFASSSLLSLLSHSFFAFIFSACLNLLRSTICSVVLYLKSIVGL